ncbi:MAG: N-6 DNA methylase [Acidimicrobiia bacterium]
MLGAGSIVMTVADVPRADRARPLADLAATLAWELDVRLPDDLRLWEEAGGPGERCRRAQPSCPTGSADPARSRSAAARVLVEAMEAALSPGERRRGAHYTPVPVAEHVVHAALPVGAGGGPVVDPTCGAGALLLVAADRLVAAGHDRGDVARDLLFGADLEPLALAVAEAAIALWSGGIVPGGGQLVVGDPLQEGRSLWPSAPTEGFGAVVGNPPFQGQLARATARSPDDASRLRDRFGAAAAGAYVDTAVLFLLVGLELAAPGARISMVQPQSTVAARDAGPVRAEVAKRARLVELWAPRDRLFAARVHVCVPVLEVGEGDGASSWSDELAVARGVPRVALPAAGPRRPEPALLRDRALVLATFRDHHYGLIPHVSEADSPTALGSSVARPCRERGQAVHPLVTSGLLGIGHCAWGDQPVRFAKRWWDRPTVDVHGVRAGSRRLDGWLGVVLAPKLVVASQTKVLEAAADAHGRWVPSTPTISVVPADPTDLEGLLAAVCSPVASAWVARQAAGTALGTDTVRVTRALLEELPLPVDDVAWAAAVEALAAGDLEAYGEAATAMYGLGRRQRCAIVDWWRPRARSAWLPEGSLR